MKASLGVNLEKLSKTVNLAIPFMALGFFLIGYNHSFYWHFLTVTFILLTVLNFFYRHVQKGHSLLSNYGVLAQLRYILESFGPEFRQYLFTNDTEERPFSRDARSEVYRKSKNVDSSAAFGSQLDFDGSDFKLRHSMYPISKKQVQPYTLTFGEGRELQTAYTIHQPVMISGMSYGALGDRAVRALARGAARAGIIMNTGEGGYPKYHLQEGCDLIFQMGTAKFGVRDSEGHLDTQKLEKLAQLDAVKMIEIKFSQGAKPGKGGILPKEKITAEIAELRGVPLGKDVISPPCHAECHDASSTVAFIRQVQEVSSLPVGIKLCVGHPQELGDLVRAMKQQNVFPDYIAIDGAEGGTGAAPKAFMDDLGTPLFEALPLVTQVLNEENVRDKVKLICSGKLVNPGRQFMAYSLGAQACYTARGFMLALGCIQAMQCHRNTCPVGITSHQRHLQRGLDIEDKAERVRNYVLNLGRDHVELLAALGKRSIFELSTENLIFPKNQRFLSSQGGER